MPGFFQTREAAVDGNMLVREPQREAYAAIQKFAGEADREAGVVLPVGCGKSGTIAISPFAFKSKRTTDPEKPWHRDGWMFQVISWIAAHLQNPEDLIAPPHMIHAHKGFDGIHVRVDRPHRRCETVPAHFLVSRSA